jgi:transcriptional regulator with XRE-family HTH domain
VKSSGEVDVGRRFREQLRFYRDRRRLTQTELGNRSGIAPAAISHFETGQRVPSLESLVKLADALDVPVDALLGRATSNATALDPILLKASQASSEVRETVRKVAAALLRDLERSE